MVVVLVIVVALSWLEQEVSGNHLEDSAGERPDIGTGVVVGSDDDLWRSVLTSLDLRREVMVCPATVSHVADLDHHLVIKLTSSLALKILKLLLHFLNSLLVFLCCRFLVILEILENFPVAILVLLNIDFKVVNFSHGLLAVAVSTVD